MLKAPTSKSEEKDISSRLSMFRFMAVSMFMLNLLAAIVMLLIPLGVLQRRGIFPGRPERSLGSLWLLFMFSLGFGIIFFIVGAAKGTRRNLSHAIGSLYLVLSLVSALEVFLLKARPFDVDGATSTTSLWWLFVTYTIMGGIGVYLPVRVVRLEYKAAREEEERKAKEEGRVNLRIVRVKVKH
jgi:hypothetical protein